jgi:hypothetical protein
VKATPLKRFAMVFLVVLLVTSGLQALAADTAPALSCPNAPPADDPPGTDPAGCDGTDECSSSSAAQTTTPSKQSASKTASWNVCQPQAIDVPRTIALAVALALLYWLGCVTVRWHRIAKPTRELLRAQIYSIDAEFDLLSNKPAGAQRLKDLIIAARDLVAEGPASLADFLFWSRGKEITGWGYVHEVQVQMAAMLSLETVDARMTTVQAKLLVAKSDPVAAAVAEAIGKALTAKDPVETKRPLLAEALELDYDRTDNSFAYLLSWQNKAAWLVAFGLLLALAMACIAPTQSIFLLIGAVGGLLSRLARSLERNDVPTDYGASWATLFLSPVAGALGGWSGCLVSALAVKAQVLGSLFTGLWACPTSTFAVGAALAFGFSERLFSGVLSKLVDKTVGPQDTSASQPASPVAPPGQKQPPSGPPAK